jgi:hypothetical protein
MATFARQQEIRHDIGSTGRLAVKLTEGDVRIRATDGREAVLRIVYEISAASEEEADRVVELAGLDVTRGDGWLEVRDRQDRDRLGSAIRRLISGQDVVKGIAIEGEAPAACELRIDTVSGDLVIDGMRGEQRYTTTSGDVYATALNGSVRLTTVSGDATLRGTERLAVAAETV